MNEKTYTIYGMLKNVSEWILWANARGIKTSRKQFMSRLRYGYTPEEALTGVRESDPYEMSEDEYREYVADRWKHFYRPKEKNKKRKIKKQWVFKHAGSGAGYYVQVEKEVLE